MADRIAASIATGALLLLAGCATATYRSPLALTGNAPQALFNTGRIQVVLTDYGGRPLKQARVDVESVDKEQEYFRTAAFTDIWGRVSFSGVPGRVRVSVDHAETRGSYSREFDVPSIGITELRMLIETFN